MIPALSLFFIFNAACCFLITGLGAKVAWDARAGRLAAASALQAHNHPEEIVRAGSAAKDTGPMICVAFACPLLAIPGGLILSHNYFFPKLDLDFYVLGLALLFGPAAYLYVLPFDSEDVRADRRVEFSLYRTVRSPAVIRDLESAAAKPTSDAPASGKLFPLLFSTAMSLFG